MRVKGATSASRLSPVLAGQDEPAMALTALLAKHRLGAVRVSGDADGAPQC
jgi:hypothetical protein